VSCNVRISFLLAEVCIGAPAANTKVIRTPMREEEILVAGVESDVCSHAGPVEGGGG